MARRLSAIAQAAEEVGCEHISVMDHYFQIGNVGPPEDPMLEAYSTLGFLAAVTSRIKLHVLVTGVTYRHPGLLAKIVTTVDVLSGGRAELAIGAAWNEQEHRGLGVRFPPVAERFERLEETLQICLQMWSENDGPFRGTHYQLDETICSPRPLTAPHPPIIIGGGGEPTSSGPRATTWPTNSTFCDATATTRDVTMTRSPSRSCTSADGRCLTVSSRR